MNPRCTEPSIDAYQRSTRANMDRTSADTHRDRLAMLALGLTGEAGETVELVKKHLWHDKRNIRARALEEMGDTLWYLVRLADELGFTMTEIMTANQHKLAERYPK